MDEKKINLPDDYRQSNDTVFISLPKWFEKTANVFGVEKTFHYDFTGDADLIAQAICKFVADRAAVDIRHRDFSKNLVEEILLPSGQKKKQTKMLPLFTTKQIEEMPRVINAKIEDHAPKKAGGEKKKKITAEKAINAVPSMTPEELKRLIEEATKALNK